MCAAAVFSAGSGFRLAKRPARFLIIGLGATLLYALLAAVFSMGDAVSMRPASASVLAYAIAAVFSYAGHKYFTFVSSGAHRFEAPRFFVLTLLGLAVSFLLPAVLSGILGLQAQIPIVLTCLVIPLVNYVMLRHWVFASAGLGLRNGSR
ncbi:GtrA family protein [Mesorhizobium sp. M0208]|uniref:GtrA family protein n=1 Tax=unclassified Mesorhizobium TaxID=325217 RepID=UPI003338237C